jgi:hypothetical protein
MALRLARLGLEVKFVCNPELEAITPPLSHGFPGGVLS